MPLPRQTAQTPTSIGEIRVAFLDPDGTNPNRGARYSVEVLDAAGEPIRTITGDLKALLSATQLQRLAAFLDDLRTQAETEIL